MQTIELYLNIIHYCYYKAIYKLYVLSNKINPFVLIHKLPFQKRRYEKLGIDIRKEINKAYSDKKFGISVTFSGGYLIGLLFLFIFGVFSLIRKLFTTENLEGIHFIFFGVSSVILCYFFVLKENKYIKYFNKFEKWNKEEKRKYSWFTFAITVAFFYLCILGF